jgi:hypothetical protein
MFQRSLFKRLRKSIMVYLAHDIGLPYFKLTRKPRNFPYSMQQLQSMREGSVGASLLKFLKQNNLDLLPYYEKHDIKHVVLGYDATEEGEVSLQCFMLANGRRTLPVILCVLYGWLTMPEYYSYFREAWRRGRSVPPINDYDWFAMPPLSLQEVRQQLQIAL